MLTGFPLGSTQSDLSGGHHTVLIHAVVSNKGQHSHAVPICQVLSHHTMVVPSHCREVGVLLQSGPQALNSSKNDFERGAIDVFNL